MSEIDWRDYLADAEDVFGEDGDPIPPRWADEEIDAAICECIDEEILPLLPQAPQEARAAVLSLTESIHGHLPPGDYRGGRGPDPVFIQILNEAADLLRDGLADEAQRRLMLAVEPKFYSVPACVSEYGTAMGEVWGPPAPEPWQFALFSLPPAQDMNP